MNGSGFREDRRRSQLPSPVPVTGVPVPTKAGKGRSRLLSLPTSSFFSYAQNGDHQLMLPQILQGRKLSEVGSAVRARLGQTIGWRRASSTKGNSDQIVDQAKSICGRYLRCRLRDAPLIVQKKLSFQRLKSVSNMASSEDMVPNVLAEIRLLCKHLETANPELFGSLLVNVGLRSLPSNEHAVQSLLTAVVAELFRGEEVSWGRLAAMFAVTGALALDCVKANKPELVLGLVDTTAKNVECYAANWISQQGGWEGLTEFFRNKPGYSKFTLASAVLFTFCCSCVVVLTIHTIWARLDISQSASILSTMS